MLCGYETDNMGQTGLFGIGFSELLVNEGQGRMKEQTKMLGTTQEADPSREMLLEWGQGQLCGPSGPLKSRKVRKEVGS